MSHVTALSLARHISYIDREINRIFSTYVLKALGMGCMGMNLDRDEST